MATGSDSLPPFVFVAQEKTPPYLVGVYELDAGITYQAAAEISDVLPRIADCIKEDEWPGYDDGIITLYQ